MKKSILSASIAAMIGGLGFAGLANAAVNAVAVTPTGASPVLVDAAAVTAAAATNLVVNEAGTGHILTVPYFTTQGTNATLLNITNTDTVNGKLVKVRFRGASNSDDIFDFTLLMSPGDVWTANVSAGTDGRSRLVTSDKSCTLPAIVATQANSFPTNRLNPALSDAAKAAQTREGYIEILNMANIPPVGNTNQGATAPAVNPLFAAVKHVNGVAPCTATTLNLLRTNSTLYHSGAAGVVPDTVQGKGLSYPSGQLMANWTIIDTVKAATFSGAATAVRAAIGTAPTSANGLGNVVFFPQSDDAAGDVDAFTADPLLRTDGATISRSNPADGQAANGSGIPLIAASFYDLPDLSTPYLLANVGAPLTQAQNLTAAFATRSVVNEYLTTTSIGATTDWVFSMPTRRYNVAFNYAYNSPVGGDGRVFSLWAANYFDRTNTSVVAGQICVSADTGTAGVNQWDREETTTSSQFVISPGNVATVRFCGETSVLAINNGTNTASGSLSAAVALQNLNVNANEGWIALGTSGLANRGLPVIGGAFAKSSAFGAMWPHRYAR